MNKEELLAAYAAGRRDFTGVDLSGANLCGTDLQHADLSGANLCGADLSGADLSGADLTGADLTGAVGFRFPGSPDPMELRRRVAEQILEHPDLHDQRVWGQMESCGTPCCVAGWACRFGGGTRGHLISTAATVLLHCDGYRLPSFAPDTAREDILRDLTVPLKDHQ